MPIVKINAFGVENNPREIRVDEVGRYLLDGWHIVENGMKQSAPPVIMPEVLPIPEPVVIEQAQYVKPEDQVDLTIETKEEPQRKRGRPKK